MGCPFAASTAISNAAPFWFRSVAQTTSPSSSSAVTSARRVRISSLSLAIFRDSNLVPPSSSHSDQTASLNKGWSRCKTQRGQSFQAVKTATTRKPYPVPPGQSEAHDTPETTHQHSKELSCPQTRSAPTLMPSSEPDIEQTRSDSRPHAE